MMLRAVLAAVVVAAGWVGAVRASDLQPSVFAVNAPLAHIAQELGGERVRVLFSVPEGTDPAMWTPEADDILGAQQADLILLNGAGYAAWTKSAVLPRARLVNSAALFPDRLIFSDGTVHQHGPDGAHAGGDGFAFTTWMDPDLAALQVEAVAQAMVTRWPELAPGIRAGQATLTQDLSIMDAALRDFFERVQGRQIITSHPVYQYLERQYGQQFVTLHWEPDMMPDAGEWERLKRELVADKAPLMLWEGPPAPDIVAQLDLLGVDWLVLSPMASVADRQALFSRIGAQVSAAD